MNKDRIRNYSAQGIIISRHDLAEADRILRIFTAEQGKISAIAKGVKKSTSKLAGRVELFTTGRFGLIKGSKLDILISAEDTHHPGNASSSLDILSHFYLAAEFLNKILPENSPAPALFEEAAGYFQGSCSEKSYFLTYKFIYKAIGLLGYGLSLSSCQICSQALPGNRDQYFLDLEKGGVVCEKCRSGDDSQTISRNTLKLLRYIEQNKFATYSSVAPMPESEDELSRLVESYILRIYHRELKSTEFIRKINRL